MVKTAKTVSYTYEPCFLTAMPNLEQSGVRGNWYLKDNVLFQDFDGSIYLVPRWFVTDLYTIPDWLAWLAGDSAGRDIQPALHHDFGCDYHALIKVNLTYEQLCASRFLRAHLNKETNKWITVCEDIPKEYLELIPFTKGGINDLFGRAMKAVGTIGVWGKGVIRSGVAFNFGWCWSKKAYDWDKLYKYCEVKK